MKYDKGSFSICVVGLFHLTQKGSYLKPISALPPPALARRDFAELDV